MALQITECQGVFSVYGVLNAGNAQILNRHMDRFIDSQNEVILNLDSVLDMDISAAHALKQLYRRAMRSNSILSIIGKQNKNILPALQAARTHFVLSDDRI